MHERQATKTIILNRNSSERNSCFGCGAFYVFKPFEVPSLGGNKYFVSFVNEFIRMTWVTLIKFKHEVFVEFNKFKVKDENQSGQRLKILGTDGRGEFNST